MSNFISQNELQKSRKIKRKLQEETLRNAKNEFDMKNEYDKKRKDHREDMWVTSTLENRIKLDTEKQNVSRQHKKSKKKHKKKKIKKYSSASESSGMSSQEEWIENKSYPNKIETIQDDILKDISTYTSKEVKETSTKSNDIDNQTKQLSCFEKPGQHSRELNPFWKSGGTGLPSNLSKSNCATPSIDWLERSYKRMQEQSSETGRTLEDIASERYGSFEIFQNLLDKARQNSISASARPRKFMKPQDGEYDLAKKNIKPTTDKNIPRWKKVKPSISVSSASQNNAVKQNIVKESGDDAQYLVKSDMPEKSVNSVISVLSEEEKNKIAAKLIKAELMGNVSLIEKLKKKLDDSKQAESVASKMTTHNETNIAVTGFSQPEILSNSESSEESCAEETVVLMRTSKKGQSWPVLGPDDSINKRHKKKIKALEHADDGKREKYYADDDKYSLKDLVKQEKSGMSDGNFNVMSRLSAKAFTKASGDSFMLDDIFEAEAGKNFSYVINRQKEIAMNKMHLRRLEKCKLCFGNPENSKHLIVAAGRVAYIKIPSHQVLQNGHCIIAPMHHSATGTSLDEDIWEEFRKFMQSLCNMSKEQGKEYIFLQTCLNLHKAPHFFMECIPLPYELSDVAPIYFKKAIQECESEWSQNKKLVDTRGKSVKEKVPAGLPYFAVDFGLGGGFAHVIEDEKQFPYYFGREILGGMLDADPYLWRKPKEDSFNEQLKRNFAFEKLFRKYDWTSTEVR